MRWDCPHCATPLTVMDDKLSTGWSFSRCFQCGGFSLVRKSDVNLIKVDQAPNQIPQGEKIVTTEKPTAALSGPSFYPVAPKSPAIKPIVRPGVREQLPPQALPAPESILHHHPQQKKWNWMTAAIGIASALALFSGGLLYMEGQSIWSKAHSQVSASQPSFGTQAQEAAASATLPGSDAGSAVAPAPAVLAVAALPRDEISQVAAKSVPAPEDSAPFMRVKIRTSYANMRTGPSLDFQVSGMASQGTVMRVLDFEDRWFKVAPLDQPQAKARWIRNDMVQLAQADR